MAKKIKKDQETHIDKGIKKYLPLIISLAVLAIIFLVLYYFFQGMGKVEYQGLTFIKQKFGSVQVYSYNYLVESPNGKIIQNTLYLRGDPSKNKAPLTGEIIYREGVMTYISINATGLTKCNYSLVSIATLTNFLVSNNLNVKGGTPDKEEAEQNNQTYATCEEYPYSTVIMIRAGNETKVEKTEENCYVISAANCEILPAVEKFIVQSILDARARNSGKSKNS
jgi:hypothetical protein